MVSFIDHIVVGAFELEKAKVSLEKKFGVPFSEVGRHDLMATKNRLLRMQGNSYLELISVDSLATTNRPRWFSLDSNETKKALTKEPKALAWVVSVENILHTKNNCGFETGRIIKMKRGKFEWKLTVPDDGSLPEGGILPVLIEWSDELNPSHALVKSGVFLEKILIKHPDKERIDGILRRLNIQAEITVEIGPKNFCFHLRSEKGRRVIWCKDGI